MKEKEKSLTVVNDRFKQHEILDRVYLIRDMFSRYVEENEEVVQADPEFTIAAAKVGDALEEFINCLASVLFKIETVNRSHRPR